MTERPNISCTPIVVLVADDEALVRMAAEIAFDEAGFTVIQVGCAAAAIQELEDKGARIDALFTDVNMPGPMNGLKLAQYTHDHWPGVSLLVTSGRTDALVADMPDECRFFPKPYDLDRVVNHIRQLARAA